MLFFFVNFFASVGLILCNKALLKLHGFESITTLTVYHYCITALGLIVMGWMSGTTANHVDWCLRLQMPWLTCLEFVPGAET